jgi:hypothetical protein
LREQLAAALARISELEAQLNQGGAAPRFVKPNRPQPAEAKGPRHKRAAAHNTSRKRMVATRIERHALERCAECAYRLRGESLDYSREVVELPPPQPVAVIAHQVVKRWCPHWACWRRPQLDLTGQVFGQGRIGVRIASVVAYLRTTLRLPVRLVHSYLQTLHGRHLSIGAGAPATLAAVVSATETGRAGQLGGTWRRNRLARERSHRLGLGLCDAGSRGRALL